MKIEPDQGLLLMWARATTGANEHSMCCTRNAYNSWCREGNVEKVKNAEEYMRRTLRALYKQDGYASQNRTQH